MRHYICTGGCGGESSNPKVCESEMCVKEDEPLTSCECDDGRHEGAYHLTSRSERAMRMPRSIQMPSARKKYEKPIAGRSANARRGLTR